MGRPGIISRMIANVRAHGVPVRVCDRLSEMPGREARFGPKAPLEDVTLARVQKLGAQSDLSAKRLHQRSERFASLPHDQMEVVAHDREGAELSVGMSEAECEHADD